MVEQLTLNQLVGGSSPPSLTILEIEKSRVAPRYLLPPRVAGPPKSRLEHSAESGKKEKSKNFKELL